VPFTAGAEQDLGHGQTDQRGVRELRWPTESSTWAEHDGDGAVQLLDEGVEIGVHEASMVDVADATPILGSLVMFGTVQHPDPTSESLI
jgi:hypothetical protein